MNIYQTDFNVPDCSWILFIHPTIRLFGEKNSHRAHMLRDTIMNANNHIYMTYKKNLLEIWFCENLLSSVKIRGYNVHGWVDGSSTLYLYLTAVFLGN